MRSQPSIQMGEMAMEIDAARLLVCNAARLCDGGVLFTKDVAGEK
jgi:hypothetical protein